MSLENTPSDENSSPRLQRFICAILIVIAAAASLADVLNTTQRYSPRHWPDRRPPHSPFFSANDRSRWCTVWSLVERGTYSIDEIVQRPGWETIDIVRWKDGHFYSSKPTLLPTLVAGVYLSVKQITGWNLDAKPHEVAYCVLLIVNWLPWMIALCLIAVMANRYARTGLSAVFVVAVAASATFLSTFLITLNNHTVAAWSVVFTIFPAIRIIADGKRNGIYFALSGLFAAFTVTNELPAFVFGIALFVMLARQSLRQTCMWFIPAALLPIAGFFYTTYLATGGLVPFYAYFGTEVYQYVHNGVPSYWMNPQGIDAGGEPRVTYLLNCLIGHHGILSLSPVFLLTIAGWIGSRRWPDFPLRPFSLLGLGLTVWMLLFIALTTNNYGGNTSGLRWVFWLIPFWLLSMIAVIDEWGHRKAFRAAACLLLAVSVYSASSPRSNPWRPPWMMNLMQRWGWADYRTPPSLPDRPLNCWIPSLPVQETVDGRLPFTEFRGVDELGKTARLRLTSQAQEELNGEMVRRVEVQTETGYGSVPDAVDRFEVLLSEKAIAEGLDATECLVWREPPTPREAKIAEVFLNGMPRQRQYYFGSTRYLKTALSDDAIACRKAVSQISYLLSGTERAAIYRRELWLSPRVPFGVVQYLDLVTDAVTNEILFRRVMTASGVSRLEQETAGEGEL